MGGRGAGYSLTGSGERSDRTRASIAKLERLKSSFGAKLNEDWDSTRARQGEPLHLDSARGRANFARAEKRNASMQSIQKQIERQERVVDRQIRRDNAKGSLFNYKGQLVITSNNLKQVKAYLKDIASGKVKARVGKATVRNWNKKVANLESTLKSQSKVKLTSGAKKLIDSGYLTQYSKKPNTYFIKGLKKTAVELQSDGTFKRSARYSGPATEAYAAKIDRFIKTGELR